MVTVAGLGTAAGAVYRPVTESMVPLDPLVPPWTVQVTPELFGSFWTVALKGKTCVTPMVAEPGEIVTTTPDWTKSCAVSLFVVSATASALI